MPQLIELARNNREIDLHYEREFGRVFLNHPAFSLHKANPDVPRYSFGDYEKFVHGLPFPKLLQNWDIFSYIRERLIDEDCAPLFEKSYALRQNYQHIIRAFTPLFPYDFRTNLDHHLPERVQLTVDETLSDKNRETLALILDIDPKAVRSRDRQARTHSFYDAFANANERYRLSPQDIGLSKAVCEDTFLLPKYVDEEFYESYRDGGFPVGRPGIRLFDVATRHLLDKGDFFIKEGRGVIPKQAERFKRRDILKLMRDMVSRWSKGRKPSTEHGSDLSDEITSATERLSWDWVFTPQKHNDLYPDWLSRAKHDNVGGILGLGLIFTEQTRKDFVDHNLVRTAFRHSASRSHPDKEIELLHRLDPQVDRQLERTLQENAFKRINSANNILGDPEKFRQWLRGAPLDSL